MRFALGVLNWSPSQFWQSTMHELMAANEGYIKANTVESDDNPMTRDEYEDLKKLLDKQPDAK
jgi:hypothetical protein